MWCRAGARRTLAAAAALVPSSGEERLEGLVVLARGGSRRGLVVQDGCAAGVGLSAYSRPRRTEQNKLKIK